MKLINFALIITAAWSGGNVRAQAQQCDQCNEKIAAEIKVFVEELKEYLILTENLLTGTIPVFYQSLRRLRE
ncbi:hypothetical protein ACHAW5_002183 [Stephanodiscus triporus]|uniref:Uncharacterized protein n=1 Tax=Stephanodiscus triporus TaxID=2934178 RepID=A0ABD3NFQ1_9STRA